MSGPPPPPRRKRAPQSNNSHNSPSPSTPGGSLPQKNYSAVVQPNEVYETIIGAGVHVRGVLRFDRLLRIDGTFSGQLISAGDVVVGPQGRLAGDVAGIRVLLVDGGVMQGNVSVEKLVLRGNARLEGDVVAKSLSMDPFVTISGRLNVHSCAPELIDENGDIVTSVSRKVKPRPGLKSKPAKPVQSSPCIENSEEGKAMKETLASEPKTSMSAYSTPPLNSASSELNVSVHQDTQPALPASSINRDSTTSESIVNTGLADKIDSTEPLLLELEDRSLLRNVGASDNNAEMEPRLHEVATESIGGGKGPSDEPNSPIHALEVAPTELEQQPSGSAINESDTPGQERHEQDHDKDQQPVESDSAREISNEGKEALS